MKRRILTIMLAACVCASAAVSLEAEKYNAYAAENEETNTEITSGDYKYELLEDGTARITGYAGGETDIEIPAVLDGKKVAAIGEGVFYNFANLTSVIIPEGVKTIENAVFLNCGRLAGITIPKSVESFGYRVFENTQWLNEQFAKDPLVVINRILVAADAENLSGTIEMPEEWDINKIGVQAFKECAGLTNIVIPESVTDIELEAFDACTGLTRINLPESVRNIGSCAFRGCSSLAEVTIPESVVNIGNGAFENTLWQNNQFKKSPFVVVNHKLIAADRENLIGEISIPEGVTDIACTFPSYYGLTAVTLPEGITSIPPGTFYWCQGIKSITIPKSVTSIGASAFERCYELKDIYYAGNKEQWNAISIDFNIVPYWEICGNEALKTATVHYNSDGNHSQGGNEGGNHTSGSGDNDSNGNTNQNTMTSVPETKPIILSKAAVSTITNTTNGIEITWNPVANAATYDIYRRIPNGGWTKIVTVNSNVTKYEDKTVKSKNGTMYGYRIQAVNKNVKGEYGNEKTTYRLSSPKLTSVKNNQKGKAVAEWKKCKKINGYEICYGTSKNFKKATIKKVKSASKKSYTINKLKKKKTYYIWIRSYKKVNGTVYHSAWSGPKKLKIKK